MLWFENGQDNLKTFLVIIIYRKGFIGKNSDINIMHPLEDIVRIKCITLN